MHGVFGKPATVQASTAGTSASSIKTRIKTIITLGNHKWRSSTSASSIKTRIKTTSALSTEEIS